MRMLNLEYIRSLINADSRNSSKRFALIVSTIISAIIGLTVCFCLVYDVTKNGYIKTDLESLGFFLICAGFYMIGGGFNKAVYDNRKEKKGGVCQNEPDKKEN